MVTYRSSPEYKAYLKAKAESEQQQANTPTPPPPADPSHAASPVPPQTSVMATTLPTVVLPQQPLPQQQQQQKIVYRVISAVPQQQQQQQQQLPQQVVADPASERIVPVAHIEPSESGADPPIEPVNVKLLAKARYMRNMYLADTLFSFTPIPDPRPDVATDARIKVLSCLIGTNTNSNHFIHPLLFSGVAAAGRVLGAASEEA